MTHTVCSTAELLHTAVLCSLSIDHLVAACLYCTYVCKYINIYMYCPIGVGSHPHLSTYLHSYHLFQLYIHSYKGDHSRYIHKVRWGMQYVMSNSYLLSSSPVGKVCSDPALLFIIHYIYHFVLLMLDPGICGALKHILLRPLPLLHSDLVLGQQRFHQHGTPWTCTVVCMCQRGWSSTPEGCQDCQRVLPLLLSNC